ncbi:MAG: hypothetical protein HYX63_21165 [Gammaproteobacteria bacterium]|nr:hypothetical protein [Gammaproteobacteria bacterium]
MREKTELKAIERLMQLLARHARSKGTVYFTGGASAVLLGWRDMTLDIDLKLEPEPDGVFIAIRDAKEELGINIELAAPDDFIPAVPGWQERSLFIVNIGAVEFRHYDFYGQALSKIERGHAQDAKDVQAMLERKLIEPAKLQAFFETILQQITRFPALDADAFRKKLMATLAAFNDYQQSDVN